MFAAVNATRFVPAFLYWMIGSFSALVPGEPLGNVHLKVTALSLQRFTKCTKSSVKIVSFTTRKSAIGLVTASCIWIKSGLTSVSVPKSLVTTSLTSKLP